MAAARYTWMFRAAAVVFLALGLAWAWTFGFTDFHPEQRPYGLAAAALAVLTGVFLLRRHKLAIGMSAAVAALVGISAAVFAPTAHGPVILFLAALAVGCCLYAVFAVRSLAGSANPGGER